MRRLVLVIPFLVFGCAAPTNKAQPKVGAIYSTDSSSPVSVPKPRKPKPQVPDELKNDAYDYFGLANVRPLDLEESTSESPQVITGSQIIRLVDVRNGVAKYKLENTGNLADIGTSELELSKDGLRVTKSSVAKIGDHPSLELPGSLMPGVTWESIDEVDASGHSLKIKSTLKVIGIQEVKTKRGALNALLVESSGSGTENSQTATIKARSWYVKGLGNVKTVIDQTVAGKKSTITIQISH